MKHKLLNRNDVDQQIAELFEAAGNMSEEDQGRYEFVEVAIKTQQDLYKQLDNQEKAIQLLWDAAHVINPDSPLTAALNISANAERLTTILKSYSTTSSN